ncbi:USP domain-containing protein [Plasmodiophora brassicae]|uniref:USP domain-containing protein n=1 Tax=Plasmodiophora brassicae TaxID=37360 RepID=A0A3P3Y060_PLABS|nr:unnamed protein product [Plasmodiophora brassicae]
MDWTDFIDFPWTPLSSAQITFDHSTPITSAAFSPTHEVVWFGDETGRISCHDIPELNSYSAAFVSPGGPIRGLIADAIGVTSIASDGVYYNTMGCHSRSSCLMPAVVGAATSHLQHSHTGQQSLLIGTDHGVLVTYNYANNRIDQLNISPTAPVHRLVMSGDSRALCIGLSTGSVDLRDPRTFERVHTVVAHQGALADLASYQNLLITAGYSRRGMYEFVPDATLKVYDLRTFRELSPVPAPVPITTLHWIDQVSGSTLLAVSQSSRTVQLIDANDLSTPAPAFPMDCGSDITVVATGLSGGIVFGHTDGSATLWNDIDDDDEQFHTSAYGQEPEPALEPGHDCSITLDFEEGSLSAVGDVPDCAEALLSTWDHEITKNKVTLDMYPVDVREIPGLIWKDGLGIAPVPTKRAFKRNHIASIRQFTTAHRARRRRVQAGLPKLPLPGDMPDSKSLVEKGYARAVVKSGRLGTNDFNFSSHNHTSYCGLDNLFPNSYCNSAFQALFFIVPVRVHMMNHVCDREICLMCELGFLFHMMANQKERPVEPRNVLRVVKLIPEATALNLLDTADPSADSSISVRIQHFFAFVLEYLSKEGEQNPGAPSSLIKFVFGSEVSHAIECLGTDSHVSRRSSTLFQIKLVYPPSGRATFESVLVESLWQSYQMRVWCSHCNAYTPNKIVKCIHRLPNALVLAAHIKTEQDLAHWRPPPKSNVGSEPVSDAPWLPSSILLDIKTSDGKPAVQRVGDDVEDDISESRAVYDLAVVIAQVLDTAPPEKGSVLSGYSEEHLVAHIRTDDNEWVLFNDFALNPSTLQEAVNFSYIWKHPCLVIYRRRSFDTRVTRERIQCPTQDFDIWSNPSPRVPSFARRTPLTFTRLGPNERLGKGTLVAIDCEFVSVEKEEVEIQDGNRVVTRPNRLSLARVSVLRGEGDMACEPFIDYYIQSRETIVDYLTEFSGVHPGDLDPSVSAKHLTTLKRTYIVLRSLVDKGVCFIGHGLKKDFQIINLYVPSSQVKDTVELFWIQGRRYLSLRFLAQHVLGIQVQKSHHDSIEDARTALLLYRKYNELAADGTIATVIQKLYDAGMQSGFK